MTTMSNHDEFADSLAGYALDALEANERRALEAHLPTCAQCQAELADLRRVTAALGGAVTPVAPTPELKAKVIARATAQAQAPQPGSPSRFLRRPAITAPTPPAPMTQEPAHGRLVRVRRRSRSPLPLAASIALALGLGAYAWLLRSEIDSLRQQVTQMSVNAETLRGELAAVRRDAARLAHTTGVLGAPVLMKVDLKGTQGMPAATGRAFMNPERGLVFNADHLAPLPAGQGYQLWVINDGKPIAIPNTFRPDANGLASVNAPMPAGVTSAQIIAVTIEPAGVGSTSPTTQPILAGNVIPG